MTNKPPADKPTEPQLSVITAEPRTWVEVAPGVKILLERDHPTDVQVSVGEPDSTEV